MFKSLTKTLLAIIAAQTLALPCLADDLDYTPPAFNKPNVLKQLELKKKELNPQDFFPRSDLPLSYPQPVPLQGVKIRGLGPDALYRLGQNYFVVVTNSDFTNMVSVYKDNRLHGRSNFVTTDSIIHPYFAFTNRLEAEVIKRHLAPEVVTLLKSMLKVSLADLESADDAEVRDDIEHNTASLLLAIKLYEPAFSVSSNRHVEQMVTSDLQAIDQGGQTRSQIFDADVDFSVYQPIGWYRAEPALARFYRMRQWLSHLSLPLSDVSFDIEGRRGNNFRRAVLLYRCLDQARISLEPANNLYAKVVNTWLSLAPQVVYEPGQALYPKDFASIFATLTSNLKVTTENLSQPLYRTKLLLTIKKQKPVPLGSASIFELGSATANNETDVFFHLFPAVDEPELVWARRIAQYLPPDPLQAQTAWPLALYFLHAHAAGQANNELSGQAFLLDPQIVKVLDDLERLAGTPNMANTGETAQDRRWKILETYFSPYADGVQTALRTNPWYTHRLESAIAGWVDSLTAIAQPLGQAPQTPPKPNATPPAPEKKVAYSQPIPNDDIHPPGPRPVFYHYLEPQAETYGRIKKDGEKLLADFGTPGYLPDEYIARLNDFIRLAQRLDKIARGEMTGRPIALADFQLLATIEYVLEGVSPPLPNTVHVSCSSNSTDCPGINFGIGDAGIAHVILQHDFKSTLGRGPVYTYYEAIGAPISAEHWARNLQFSMVRTPPWTQNFDIAQEAENSTTTKTPIVHH